MAWDWLLPERRADSHPVDEVLRLSEYIDSLGEYTLTFRPANVEIHRRNNLGKYLVLNNSWWCPERMPGSHKTGGSDEPQRSRAINPNYQGDLTEYAQAPVMCECGALFGTDDDDCRRAVNCNPYWAHNAQQELWQRRHDFITESYRLLRDRSYVANRLGVTTSYLDKMCRRMNISRTEIVRESHNDLEAILNELKGGYTSVELERVVGLDKSTIRHKWS